MGRKGYSYSDMRNCKRTIINRIPGGVALICGHINYFANPEDFEVGGWMYCYECPFDQIKAKVMKTPEINVSLDGRSWNAN
jgi:hypothetical protein